MPKASLAVLPIIAAALVLCACAAHSPVSSAQPATVAPETTQNNSVTNVGGVSDDPKPSDDAMDESQADWGWLEEDEADIVTIADPLEGFNRAMFTVNDKLYFWALKPVATGYRAVVPQPARSGVKNFFSNLGFPVRFANAILQGKSRAAEAELTRFLYNSTVGVLGFGNPAKKHSALNFDEEDLGQTLGRYGIGDGFYLVWPFFGPSTLRDSFGRLGDRFLDPVGYVNPAEAEWALKGVDIINGTSLRIGDYESLKAAALDPYISMRDGYRQMRQAKIKK
jgi:phospholipid-binding lipoprotein MlaA